MPYEQSLRETLVSAFHVAVDRMDYKKKLGGCIYDIESDTPLAVARTGLALLMADKLDWGANKTSPDVALEEVQRIHNGIKDAFVIAKARFDYKVAQAGCTYDIDPVIAAAVGEVGTALLEAARQVTELARLKVDLADSMNEGLAEPTSVMHLQLRRP